MSRLVVQVCTFQLKPHPNADRLWLAQPDGMNWKCCVQKEGWEGESYAIYIPIDSILSPDLADEFSPLGHVVGSGEPFRIKTMRLRNYVSQGMFIPLTAVNEYLRRVGKNTIPEEVGYDAAELLGITKFVAPDIEGADTTSNPPGFDNHTDIQSFNTFSKVIPDGTPIVATEKIHGVAMKAGWLDDGEGGYKFVLGTNNATIKANEKNIFTEVADRLQLAEKLKIYPRTTIYGELFGLGVQKKMHYNAKEKTVMFYGVSVDGEYMNYDDRVAFFKTIGVTPVPLIYRGPFTPDVLDMCEGECFSKAHIREGVVIQTEVETYNDMVGRVILKVVNPQYQLKNYDADEVR